MSEESLTTSIVTSDDGTSYAQGKWTTPCGGKVFFSVAVLESKSANKKIREFARSTLCNIRNEMEKIADEISKVSPQLKNITSVEMLDDLQVIFWRDLKWSIIITSHIQDKENQYGIMVTLNNSAVESIEDLSSAEEI